jgi:hypothetical protein
MAWVSLCLKQMGLSFSDRACVDKTSNSIPVRGNNNRIIVSMSYFLYNVSVNDTGIIFIMEGLKNSMLIYLA